MSKSSKETRMGRSKNRSSFKMDAMYYKVVAVLVAILLALVIYIFWQGRADKKDHQSTTDQTEMTKKEQPSKKKKQEKKPDTEKQSSKKEDTTAESNKKEEVSEKPSEKEETKPSENESQNEAQHKNEVSSDLIEKNAPLDKSHEVKYEDGSSDMEAVMRLSKEVTGLGEKMYAVWIGNNGPGKVQATVASTDNTQQYVVDLQFGEGAWHVTHVEQVAE